VADAVSLPVADGVKTTPTLQEAPAARLVVQAGVAPAATGVAAKSEEFVPDNATGSVRAIAAFVLFVMATFWAVLGE
jgi:hypothetical protein